MATCSFLCNLSIFLFLILSRLSTTDRIEREVTATLGSSVRLTGPSKPWKWIKSVVWNVELNVGKRCTIGNATDSRFVDTCLDGKTQGETADRVPYLHIPKVQLEDEGIYACSIVGTNEFFTLKTRLTIRENEDTTAQETYYELHFPASTTAPQSLSTQMFCIKEVKSGI